jgi:hypothetical protein
VSLIAVVAIVLMFIGIGIRLFAWRTYLEHHVFRYHEAPPAGWLWTRDEDPFVERWRLTLVIGTVLALGGAIALLVLALTGYA